MIFNSIEKEIRNFTNHNNSLTKKCSIHYNQPPPDKTPPIPKFNHTTNPRTKYDKNIQRECIEFTGTQIRRPLKQLQPQLTVPKSKSIRSKSSKTKKLFNTGIRINNILYRCHPEHYHRSQYQSPRQQEEISPSATISMRKCEGIGRKDNVRESNQSRIRYRKIQNYEKMEKEDYNQLSKTAVSLGSQLYQLSPIHFHKYMQYQDQQKGCEGSERKYEVNVNNYEGNMNNYEANIKNSEVNVKNSEVDMKNSEVNTQGPFQQRMSGSDIPKQQSQIVLCNTGNIKSSNPSTLTIKSSLTQAQQVPVSFPNSYTHNTQPIVSPLPSSQPVQNSLKLSHCDNVPIITPESNLYQNIWMYTLITLGIFICLFQLIK